jgi:hypothetical protein
MLVRKPSGVFFINYKKSGLYYSDGVAWAYLPNAIQADFVVYDKTGANLVSEEIQSAVDEIQGNNPGIQFDTTITPAMAEGKLAWNADDGTLEFGLPGGDVVLQLGQEQLAKVRNVDTTDISNGDVLYVYGATGENPSVKKASASVYDESIRIVAIATEDIRKNTFGYATTFGIVRGLATTGIAEGTMLYVGEGGAFTATPPAYPLNRVAIGVCLYEHATEGKIFFSPRIIFRKFGDPATGHYTGIDDAGHQRMYGDARPWRDELGDAINLRVQGTGVSINHTEGVAEFTTASDLNDYLYKNLQLNHDRDITAVIYPHIHFTQGYDVMPNFLLQYRWQVLGGTKVTAWTNLRCNVPAIDWVTGNIHQVAHTPAGINPPEGSNLSDIVQFRILRDNANASTVFTGADTYTGTVGILSFDVHLQINSIGSDLEYTK